jgi:hypothetical protein
MTRCEWINDQADSQWSKHCNKFIIWRLPSYGYAADNILFALDFCEQNHESTVFLFTLPTSCIQWTILF